MSKHLLSNVAQQSPYMIYFASAAGSVVFNKSLPVYFIVGSLVSDLINYLLKKSLQYPLKNQKWAQRPNPSKTGCGMVNSFGFPSGHAQNTSFAAIFWSLYILDRQKITTGSIIQVIILWIIAVLVWFSRIQNGCHNLIQVLSGAIIGFFLGLVYYYLVKNYLLKDNMSQKLL